MPRQPFAPFARLAGLISLFALTAPPVAAQEAAQPLPAVVVAAAALTDVGATARFNGRAVARQKVDIRARVSGFLLKTGFTEGGEVEAGQMLFTIDDAEYQAALAQADASVAAAEATLELAKIEYERQAELMRRGSGTQANVDQTKAEADKAAADVKRLEAQRDAAALNLSYTVISAPFAGRIGLAAADVGALVGPDSGALAQLVMADPIDVEFPVPERVLLETQASAKGAGQASLAISLTLSDGTKLAQEGRLNFADVAVSQSTDTVLVRAEFPNADRILRDGSLVSVTIEGDMGTPELTVPQQAVLRDVTGAYVLTVADDGTVAQSRVEVGRVAKGLAVITGGLAEGAMVITEGANKARPGAKVDAATADAN